MLTAAAEINESSNLSIFCCSLSCHLQMSSTNGSQATAPCQFVLGIRVRAFLPFHTVSFFDLNL